MAENVTKLISEQANKTADVMGQLGRKGLDFSTLPVFDKNIIEVGSFRVQEKEQNIAGNTLIWGNVNFGTWGAFNWGSSAQTSFVLGHSIAGVLGTSILGSNTSEFVVKHVYNDSDWFPEGFWNNRFIDTTSTGVWDNINEEYILAEGTIFISSIIAKEDKIYKSVKVNIVSEDSLGADANSALMIYASNDAGSTWQSVNIGLLTNITGGDTSGLKIKIVNNSSLTFPLIFPLVFGKDIIIKEFNVKYS